MFKKTISILLIFSVLFIYAPKYTFATDTVPDLCKGIKNFTYDSSVSNDLNLSISDSITFDKENKKITYSWTPPISGGDFCVHTSGGGQQWGRYKLNQLWVFETIAGSQNSSQQITNLNQTSHTKTLSALPSTDTNYAYSVKMKYIFDGGFTEIRENPVEGVSGGKSVSISSSGSSQILSGVTTNIGVGIAKSGNKYTITVSGKTTWEGNDEIKNSYPLTTLQPYKGFSGNTSKQWSVAGKESNVDTSGNGSWSFDYETDKASKIFLYVTARYKASNGVVAKTSDSKEMVVALDPTNPSDSPHAVVADPNDPDKPSVKPASGENNNETEKCGCGELKSIEKIACEMLCSATQAFANIVAWAMNLMLNSVMELPPGQYNWYITMPK